MIDPPALRWLRGRRNDALVGAPAIALVRIDEGIVLLQSLVRLKQRWKQERRQDRHAILGRPKSLLDPLRQTIVSVRLAAQPGQPRGRGPGNEDEEDDAHHLEHRAQRRRATRDAPHHVLPAVRAEQRDEGEERKEEALVHALVDSVHDQVRKREGECDDPRCAPGRVLAQRPPHASPRPEERTSQEHRLVVPEAVHEAQEASAVEGLPHHGVGPVLHDRGLDVDPLGRLFGRP